MVSTMNQPKTSVFSRVSKMLKPIFRRLHKKSSSKIQSFDDYSESINNEMNENALNEALEARLQQQSTKLSSVSVIITSSSWYLGAADRDICTCPVSECGAQTPEQQSPSPSGYSVSSYSSDEWW